MDNSLSKKKHYGWMIVAAVFLNMFVCGGIFFGASGVFIVPVCNALGIGQGSFTFYLTIQNLTTAAGVLVAPKLLAKISYRKLNGIAAVIAGTGFILMGFAKNVILLYVGGVLIGLGCVFLTYLIGGVLLPRWFSQKLGTAIAVGSSGIALGGIVFNPVISFLVNGPGLLGFSEGWRSAYVILGIFVILVCLPLAIFVIRDNPSDKGLLPYGAETESVEKTIRTVEGVDKSVAIKSSSFILYCVMVLCFTLAGSILSYLPALASDSASTTSVSGIIGSVAMFGAIIGGFLIGAANDKLGAHFGGIVAGTCGAIGFIVMVISGDRSGILLIGAALYGIFYQINLVQMPAMMSEMYGEREYDKIFPIGAIFQPWVAALSFSLWGFTYDVTSSYNFMLISGIVCTLVTAAAGFLAVKSSRKLPRKSVEIEQG